MGVDTCQCEAPFNQFTPYLAPYLNRVVVDRTDLDGRYDIDIKWAPEQQGAGAAPPPPPGDPNLPSIFTALQEQLGLKLDSRREMVEVLVIDTLEHPTPNWPRERPSRRKPAPPVAGVAAAFAASVPRSGV